jgi:hypothetical protein
MNLETQVLKSMRSVVVASPGERRHPQLDPRVEIPGKERAVVGACAIGTAAGADVS